MSLVLLTLVACRPIERFGVEDQVIVDLGDERVATSESTIDFGDVSASLGETGYAELVVTNVQDNAVILTGQGEGLGDVSFVIDANPMIRIEDGQSVTLPIYYMPSTEIQSSTQLVLEPGGVVVDLLGHGTAPVAVVDAVDTGETFLGCTRSVKTTVHNDGSEPLEIHSVTTDLPDATVVDFPTTIEPGQSGEIELSYAPTTGGTQSGDVNILTNDPINPRASAVVTALVSEGGRADESFRYNASDPTDIMLLVDNDDIMDAIDYRGTEVADEFVERLRDSDLDYHFIGLSGDGACPDLDTPWATRNDTSSDSRKAFEYAFKGDTGEFDTDLLGLALEAVAESETGGCIDGFRRPDAALHVIVVSSENSTMPVPERLTRLMGTVPGADNLHVSALVSTTGCAVGGSTYAAAARETDGYTENLCSTDWTAAFRNFAELSAPDTPARFTLSEEPVASTITVLIEGVSTLDWTYEAETNTVALGATAVPPLGSEVVVSFVPAETCE